MSTPVQAPFARLVEYLEDALRTTDPISIPADVLAAFRDAAQPFDDTGLRNLVKVFNASHQDNRSRLDAVTLSQLVQITFRLQSSLLQHSFIYSLLLPPQASCGDAYGMWHTSVSRRLVPTMLRLLDQKRLSSDLLVTAAHSLSLWVAGDEEAKRSVCGGQEAPRHALGTLIGKHENYVLRLVVADLVREILTDRSDGHLFWPEGIPGLSFIDFPLARVGDAAWLSKAVAFLGAIDTAKGSRADLPQIYPVKYPELEHCLAIISNDITLVLPATAQSALRFLQLPLIDGMVCHLKEGPDNRMTIRYRRTTGYQIFQGVRRAADDIHLIFGDPTQSLTFAESVHSRVAKRLANAPLALQPSMTAQRISYASIDLTQSRETSVESYEETDNCAQLSESRPLTRSPSPAEARRAVESEERQERASDVPPDLQQARITFIAQCPAADDMPSSPPGLQAIRKYQAGKGSTEPKLVMSSVRVDDAASETTSDSQRLLKRPIAKLARIGHRNDTDWDEDLRSANVEPEEPPLKKIKPTSAKTKTAKKAVTGHTFQKLSRGNDKKEKTNRSKAKVPSGKTAATTRTRRAVTAKSSKYVSEESEADVENDGDKQRGVVVEDSNPQIAKQTLSTKDEVHSDESQSQDSDNGRNLRAVNSVRNVLIGASSPISPGILQKRKHTAREEVAEDSYPMDSAAGADAIAPNDTSFGVRLAQTLTSKALLQVPAIEQPSRKSFGNAKKVVETVDLTRNISPRKSDAKDPRSVDSEIDEGNGEQHPSEDQRRADPADRDSLVEAKREKPHEIWPDTDLGPARLAEGHQNSDEIPVAQEKNYLTCIVGEDIEQLAPASVQTAEVGETAHTTIAGDDQDEEAPRGTRNEDLDAVTVVGKQMTYSKGAVAAITTVGDSDDENQVENSESRNESPKTNLSRPSLASSKWSPSMPRFRKALQEVPQRANFEKSIDPPPVPQRSKRRGVQSPINMASGDGDSSPLVTNERVLQKTPIVSFGAKGPRNQGVVSPTKQPKLGATSVLEPSETREHTAAKRQKKLVPSEPIALPRLAAPSGKVSGQGLELIEDDEEILVQREDADQSVTVGQSPGVNYQDEGDLVQQESAIELVIGADATSGRDASQLSRVNKNGSPRLSQHRRSLNFDANQRDSSTTPEQSKSSDSTSEEAEHSVYAEHCNSSPATVHPKSALERLVQATKAKMVHARGSIGLQDVMSETFPNALKSINTAVFKQQAKSTLSKPPVIFEETGPVVHKASNVLEEGTSIHSNAILVETDRAAPSPSRQQPFSETSTHVISLGPKTPANLSKPVGKASPPPSSFKTGFKNMLMPPPPLPRPRHEHLDTKVAVERQGKRISSSTKEDEDVTLIDDAVSSEHGRPIRHSTRPQRQPSPDSSADSLPSSMPELVQCQGERREADQEVSPLGIRSTQQRIQNIANSVVTGVVFRLQAAEQAIQGKTQEYHSGCRTIVDKLETNYEAKMQHERSRAAPRVTRSCETYNSTMEECSKGLRRVRAGVELSSISKQSGMRQEYLLSLLRSQMDETDTSAQEMK